jgi:23S rRNA-/tRNA-specific pseudouridylate synthase
MTLSLDIFHQDEDFIIINKPHGLPSQGIESLASSSHTPPDLKSNLLSILENHFLQCDPIKQFKSPILLHRLDSSTSGLIMVGLKSKKKMAYERHQAFQDLFTKKQILKKYYAIVSVPKDHLHWDTIHNHFKQKNVSGWMQLSLMHSYKENVIKKVKILKNEIMNTIFEEVDLSILEDKDILTTGKKILENLNMDPPKKHQKWGLSYYRIQSFFTYHDQKLCLIECLPITGRLHQLRVQLSHLKSPILGDGFYGRRQQKMRTYLHAHSLEFIHPINHKHMLFQTGLPSDFCLLLDNGSQRKEVEK